jgi:DNA-binding NarL/FixJ family response regulator
MPTIVLADDHTLIRAGLHTVLAGEDVWREYRMLLTAPQ